MNFYDQKENSKIKSNQQNISFPDQSNKILKAVIQKKSNNDLKEELNIGVLDQPNNDFSHKNDQTRLSNLKRESVTSKNESEVKNIKE